MKHLIIYTYDQNPQTCINYDFFAQTSIVSSESIDYIVCCYRANTLISEYKYSNVQIIKPSPSQNIQTAKVAFKYAIKSISNIDSYDTYTFIDSNITGPILPIYLINKPMYWHELFISGLHDKIKLVGTGFKYNGNKCPLLNELCFMVDSIGLGLIINNESFENLTATINDAGYSFCSIESEYSTIDMSDEFNWHNPQNIIPFDSMFNSIFIQSQRPAIIETATQIESRRKIKQYIDQRLNSIYSNQLINIRYGLPESNINVTTSFMDRFVSGSQVIIKSTDTFNDYFYDPSPGNVKKLFIKIDNRTYVIDETHDDVEFDIVDICVQNDDTTNNNVIMRHASNDKYIIVVAHLYIDPDDSTWKSRIHKQLAQIKKSGLLTVADMYVHITSENDALIQTATQIILSSVASITISSSLINNNEYDSMHLLWELATHQSNNHKIYLYFHFQSDKSKRYDAHTENVLFQEVVNKWRQVINIFDTNCQVNKIGYAASEQGFFWGNFWWARGSYICECVEPIVYSEFYYETWLCLKKPDVSKSTYGDCFSLATGKLDQGMDKYCFSLATGKLDQGVGKYYFLHMVKSMIKQVAVYEVN